MMRHTKFSRRLTSAFAGACLSVLPAMAGLAHADEAGLKALYEAAKAAGEDTVSIYMPAAASNQPMFDIFEAEFPGITITPTDIYGAAMFARLEAEVATGKPQADVLSSGDLDFPTLYSKGYLESYEPAGIADLSKSYVGTDNSWYVWSLVPVGPGINTDMISGDGPTSWADLLDPALKGKMAMTSATTLTTSPMAMVQALAGGAIDDAWISAFAAQKPSIGKGTSATMLSVAQGQFAVAPFMALTVLNAAKAKGAPVKFNYLKEGNAVVPLSAGLMKGAPHPNAAKLFISWLLSPSGAKIAAEKLGSVGTMPGSPEPEGMPANHKLLVLTGDAMQAALKDWVAGPAAKFE